MKVNTLQRVAETVIISKAWNPLYNRIKSSMCPKTEFNIHTTRTRIINNQKHMQLLIFYPTYIYFFK